MSSQHIGTRVITWLAAGSLLAGGCSKPPAHGSLESSASIVIEPGVSLGPVRSGMTMRQVVAELGEPEHNRDGVLEYQSLGLSVLPAKGGVVGTVLCMGSDAREPSAKPFAGHTKEGIGIGSSRADLISAYGEPTTIETRPGSPAIETLRYKPLGLDFKVRDGKVHLIAMFLKPAP